LSCAFTGTDVRGGPAFIAVGLQLSSEDEKA